MPVNKNQLLKAKSVTDKVKSDWNDFINWLDKKGLKGKPELDKNNLGNKYFEEYLRENPKTSLSKEIIPEIRKRYVEERNRGIEEIKSGRAGYLGKSGKDVDFGSFMKHIVLNEQSANPNYVGQHLTQTPFRGAILKDKLTGNVIGSSKFNDPNVTSTDTMEKLSNQSPIFKK